MTASTVVDQPLGLTVHSLPSMDVQSLDMASRTRSSRIKLMLLFLVCAAPVIASYFTYYVIRPEGRRNYGELIQPQQPLPAFHATDMQGQVLPLTSLTHQWLIISVADSACNTQCEQHLYLSRQLRESLGKDKDRMDWVWLRTGDADVPQSMRAGLSTATVLKVTQADVQTWLQPAAGQAVEDHLYVVDPMGNWMMRFPANIDPLKARKDLERLLRSSSSWDQPGRPAR
jgi:hypothetical protein